MSKTYRKVYKNTRKAKLKPYNRNTEKRNIA
uniref:Uncharacterized protein n=1 Tax=Dulem virus 42 TaxID=3145760 RepID=A0AAU8BA91_9CAUD